MYAHTRTYMTEVDQNLLEKIFLTRKKRKIGKIELYLSVMPQDVPRVRIKKLLEERGDIVIEFELIDVSSEGWKSSLLYKDEESGIEIYQNPVYKYITTIRFPADSIDKLESKIKEMTQSIEKELSNMEWEGGKVAELDMKERQISLLTNPEILEELKFLANLKDPKVTKNIEALATAH